MPSAEDSKRRVGDKRDGVACPDPSPGALPFNVLTVSICVALVLGTVELFLPVRNFEFIHYDDQDYVTENYVVQHGLTATGFRWAFTQVHSSNWHPLTWLSHMLDCQLFSSDAGKHHLTGLFFHVLTTVLVFLVVRKLAWRGELFRENSSLRAVQGGVEWRAAMVAALFAIHPLHVESVAWVSERKDVLCGFFWMLTMLAYLRYAETRTVEKGKRSSSSVPAFLLAVGFFSLGLLSKPMIVTLPCVLLLLDVWPLKRIDLGDWKERLGKLLLEKAPFFVMTVISCVVTFLAQKNSGAMRSLGDFSFSLRIENASVSYIVYLRRLFWPNDLAIFYPHPTSIPIWQPIAALSCIGLITGLVLWRFKRRPYYALGWFWYLGTLVPVLGLVQVGVQARADRFTYIPLIGIFIALVWGVFELVARSSPHAAAAKHEMGSAPRFQPALLVISALLLIPCAVVSARQIGFWRNSKTLFSHALEVTTDNFIAHQSLGTALANEERNEEAERHFREAIGIHPRFPEAEQNLGNILLGRKQFDEALVHYNKAIEYRSDFENAYNNIGLLYAKQEKWTDAIQNFQKAISIDWTKGGTHFNLGSAYLKAGRTDEALSSYEKALEIDPTIAEAHFQAALILSGRHKMEAAIRHFREAIGLRPDWTDALGQLAWIWATYPDAKTRNGAGAVEMASRAAVLTQRTDARILSVLAAAYAESGRFAEAVQAAEEARQLLLSRGQAEPAKSIEKKLQLYRANKPYHQDS